MLVIAVARQTISRNPCDCHDVVCARDFTMDPKHGFDCNVFAEWLRKRVVSGEEKRVRYVIWDRRIFSGPEQGKTLGLWRSYTGTNPHTKHIHVSVRHGADFHDDETPWHWPPSE